MTLLTKKDRTMHPQAQVAKLLRIARRAESKAEHLADLRDKGWDVESAELHRQVDRAIQACDEVVRIVNDNPDAGWTLAQRRYCATQEVER